MLKRIIVVLVLALATAFVTVPTASAGVTQNHCRKHKAAWWNDPVRVCLRVWWRQAAGNDVVVTRTRLCVSLLGKTRRQTRFDNTYNWDWYWNNWPGYEQQVHQHHFWGPWRAGYCSNDPHNVRFRAGRGDVEKYYTIGFNNWPNERGRVAVWVT